MGVKLNGKFNYANVASTKKRKMTYKDFHNEMDHCGNDLITLMVKAMGINLLGNHLNVIIVQWRKCEKQKSKEK